MPKDGKRSPWLGLKDLFFGNPALRLSPEHPLEIVGTDLAALPRDRDWLVWFGHSSYLLNLGGVRYLVDPVFGRASPIPLGGKPFPATHRYAARDIPDPDVVVFTHDHYDHLEWPTVRALRKRAKRFVCPLGVGEHLEKWGVDPDKITELDWGDRDGASGLTALPARHFSGRTFKRNQSLWASYLLEAGGKRLYLGGDGGYGKHFAAIGAQRGPIDLAILENGQYNDAWPFVHCRPAELPQAVRDLGCKAFLTVHHGKYILSHHPWDEPWENERAAAEETGVPLLSPRIGEVLWLDAF
jgi:L-ascorbate metabolism protein UlaG (beta-lactamase superfamily)